MMMISGLFKRAPTETEWCCCHGHLADITLRGSINLNPCCAYLVAMCRYNEIGLYNFSSPGWNSAAGG
jgi:hypothetical protein